MTDINNQPPKEEPVNMDASQGAPNGAQDQKASINVNVAPQNKGTSGMAVAALVLGILGIVFSFIPLINLLSFIFVVLGIIFGVVGILGTAPGKKAGRGIAIAGLVISVIAGIITFAMYGTAGSSSSSTNETVVNEVVEEGDQSTTSGSASDADASGTFEKAANSNYEVTIDSCKKTKDYNGDPAVLVTLTWTNNSDNTTSYMTSVTTRAFQDGVELDSAVISGNSDGNTMKQVKPGKSLEIKVGFKLDSESSPITIESEDIFNLGDDLLAKKDFSL